MKINRLLGIVTYLLSHEQASARQLAERFEVSARTISRDMEALGLAGIPVTATFGQNGGYRLADGWRLTGQLLSTTDYSLLLTAVRGLCSGIGDLQLSGILEKLKAVAPVESSSCEELQLDLGVMREGVNAELGVAVLRQAAKVKRIVCFNYTDAGDQVSARQVEPLTVIYRWYAWYLFGYCRTRQDYRLFRLSRMRQLQMGEGFSSDHDGWQQSLAAHQTDDKRQYLTLRLRCQGQTRVSLEERFPGGYFEQSVDGSLVVELQLPENERDWLGRLLSYGNQIEVLEPAILREQMLQKAKEIVCLYQR